MKTVGQRHPSTVPTPGQGHTPAADPTPLATPQGSPSGRLNVKAGGPSAPTVTKPPTEPSVEVQLPSAVQGKRPAFTRHAQGAEGPQALRSDVQKLIDVMCFAKQWEPSIFDADKIAADADVRASKGMNELHRAVDASMHRAAEAYRQELLAASRADGKAPSHEPADPSDGARRSSDSKDGKANFQQAMTERPRKPPMASLQKADIRTVIGARLKAVVPQDQRTYLLEQAWQACAMRLAQSDTPISDDELQQIVDGVLAKGPLPAPPFMSSPDEILRHAQLTAAWNKWALKNPG